MRACREVDYGVGAVEGGGPVRVCIDIPDYNCVRRGVQLARRSTHRRDDFM
jgi:hypothetical protein